MSDMPKCPQCGRSKFVTSDGGFKETVSTVGGAGAGIWAGWTAGSAAGAAAIAATSVAGTVLALAATPVLLFGLPLLGGYLGKKLGKSMDDTDRQRTYFCAAGDSGPGGCGYRWIVKA